MLKLVIIIQQQLARAVTDERGQGLTEYALIAAFVTMVAVVALTFLGGRVTAPLSTVARSI